MFVPSVKKKKNENNKNERKALLTAAMTNRLSTVVKKGEKKNLTDRIVKKPLDEYLIFSFV